LTLFRLDSVIYINHTDFGGRASWGATFGDYAKEDSRVHGAFAASLDIGTHHGLDTAAKVIAVKMWDNPAEGRTSNVIAALEWIISQVSKSNKPSFVNLSISRAPGQALSRAVSAAIEAGIHFAGAAGDQQQNVNLNFLSTGE
jgi:cerevisin